MNKYSLIIIGLIGAIFFISPLVIADNYTFESAYCQYFSYPPMFGGTGYSCRENTGTIRSFHDPGAYDAMYNYYVPPATLVDPQYTFVVSGASSNSFNAQP